MNLDSAPAKTQNISNWYLSKIKIFRIMKIFDVKKIKEISMQKNKKAFQIFQTIPI